MLLGYRGEELFAVMGKRVDSLKGLDSPDEWDLVESIGEGTYGEVYKVRSIITGQMAAAKVIDSILEKIEEVLPELEILKKHSDHPNIAGFYGAYIKRDPKRQDQLWLVMELCRGGSVTNLVRNLVSKGKLLDEDLIAYVLYETLKGLEYLHRHNVMHRDIKGPNVMLTNDAEIRLIDFGVSSELTHVLMKKNSSVGTPFWMAPEVIACEQQLDYSYDIRCDIWSLGITAIELADGAAPLSDEHPMRALFKIPRSKPPTMKNPEKWSHEYRDFIAKCLVKDFEDRLHASDLLQHPFLSWVPTKKLTLRRKLMGVMDSQYQGRDGIMDEIKHEKNGSRGVLLTPERQRQSPRRNKDMMMVDDLATLSSLTDDSILSHLLERFLGHQIYTYVGDILIAINPLQTLTIYDRQHSQAYRNVEKSSLPPHIYMVADVTYQAMIHNKSPQCCLISGESGAGKTVSANYLVQQLAELGKFKTPCKKLYRVLYKFNTAWLERISYEWAGIRSIGQWDILGPKWAGVVVVGGNKTLEQKILQVNPLMEALGNAQTVINDNSSRFGKYLELHFTANGALFGATLTEYLLEKSRVVHQSSEERNFHIFYYMIAGLAHQKKLEKYSFKLYSQHNYLQTGGKSLQDVVCTIGNRKRFEEVQRCFDIIGFTHEEVSSLFSVLAAVIHMGDIIFTEDESVSHLSDKSMVTNPQLLVVVSSLLSLNAVELRDALTTNSNVTRGETIVRNNTVDQAVDCRDAMAKALYGRLFSWIVQRMNVLLRSENGPMGDNDYRIGILDIFGFENFKLNSFEQLCINIANEQIQFYFNQQIFSWELEEYRQEGIGVENIKYEDNRPVLDMFLQKPIGILALLDEESRFPKATDFTLVEKFNQNIKPRFYERTRETENFPSFTIVHYAGRVKYNATNFLEKNRDTLSPDIIQVLRRSENKLVRTLIQQQTRAVRSLDKEDDPCWWRIPDSFLCHAKRRQLTQIVIADDNTGRESWLTHFLKGKNKKSFEVSKRRINTHRVFSQGNNKGGLTLNAPEAKFNSSSTSRLNQTVSMHFRFSLRDLLSKLLPTQSHFVRCIRPNANMIPGKFDQEKVMTQLKYTGVLETTRIRKLGYSERILFEDFVNRYQMIGFPMHKKLRSDASSCKAVLKAAKLEKWTLGRTKVFLKYYHIERLGKLLEDHRIRVIITQKVVRGWLARRRYAALKAERKGAAIEIQKVFRGYLAKKAYKEEIKRRRESALLLKKEEKRRLKLQQEERERALRNNSAVKIQAATRGYLARKQYNRVLDARERSALAIQSAYRGHLVRRNVTRLKADKKKEIKQRRNVVEAVIIIQSAVRAANARKLFKSRKEESEGAEIKSIFFLQQIIDSSNEFHSQQQKHRKIKVEGDASTYQQSLGFSGLRSRREMVGKLEEERRKPFSRGESLRGQNTTKLENMDDLGAQQETQRIYFIQQIENSWIDYVECIKSHASGGPRLEHRDPPEMGVRMLPSREIPTGKQRQTAPLRPTERDKPAGPSRNESQFSIRPRETTYSELHMKASQRSQRSFRKEIWSAGDETYLRSFAEDSKREIQAKDQERRVMEMLSIVEGLPSDQMNDPSWLSAQADSKPVSKARSFFEKRNPSPPPSSKLERKVSTDSAPWQRLSATPPQSSPVQQASSRVTVTPPPQVTQRNTTKVILLKDERPPAKEPRPDSVQLKSAEPEWVKPGNHVMNALREPGPKHNPVNHVTNNGPGSNLAKLRRSTRIMNGEPVNELYSHALKKTGRRQTLLGLQDDDGDSVTRVNFNVPLKVS